MSDKVDLIPFSSQAVFDGYWEIYHDDGCGETALWSDGRCPKCGFLPDLQSLGARRTAKGLKPE